MTRPILIACILALLPGVAVARPLETRDLIDRCIARAAAQGFPQPVYMRSANRQAANGAIFAQDVTLRSMTGRSENVICRHDVARGTISLMGTVEAGRDLEAIRPGGGGGDGAPSFQFSAAACTGAAERGGYRVDRVVNQTNLRRDGRVIGRLVEINARRDGRDWRLDCTYAFSDRSTRLEARRR